MLDYIDSHAHYDAEQFDPDREELLNRLHKSGVRNIVNMGCNLERSRLSVEYAEKYPFMYAAVGIHPEDVEGTPEDYLHTLKKWAVLPKTVAIGEIGLDYHYDGYDPDLQKRIFTEQLDLAEELSMPVVIHSRDARAGKDKRGNALLFRLCGDGKAGACFGNEHQLYGSADFQKCAQSH